MKDTANKTDKKSKATILDRVIAAYFLLSFAALACGADSEISGVLVLLANFAVSGLLLKGFKVDKKLNW